MKCLQSETISAYLDGELDDKKRSAAEIHFKSCAHCAGALEEMRSLRTAFSNAEQYPAPRGFSSRVMARTAALKSPSPYPLPAGERIRGMRAPAFLKFAEAAVLIVVITVGVMTGKVMVNGSSNLKTTNMSSSFSLDVFDAAPPDSLGGAYLAMTEVAHEK